MQRYVIILEEKITKRNLRNRLSEFPERERERCFKKRNKLLVYISYIFSKFAVLIGRLRFKHNNPREKKMEEKLQRSRKAKRYSFCNSKLREVSAGSFSPFRSPPQFSSFDIAEQFSQIFASSWRGNCEIRFEKLRR